MNTIYVNVQYACGHTVNKAMDIDDPEINADIAQAKDMPCFKCDQPVIPEGYSIEEGSGCIVCLC